MVAEATSGSSALRLGQVDRRAKQKNKNQHASDRLVTLLLQLAQASKNLGNQVRLASNELKRSLEKQDCVNLNWEIGMASLNLVTLHDHLAVIYKPQFSLHNKLASTLIRGET